MKTPELLLRNKKFNQMEIEMDKFLAKKAAVFKDAKKAAKDKGGLGFSGLTEQQLRYKTNSCIV